MGLSNMWMTTCKAFEDFEKRVAQQDELKKMTKEEFKEFERKVNEIIKEEDFMNPDPYFIFNKINPILGIPDYDQRWDGMCGYKMIDPNDAIQFNIDEKEVSNERA